MKKTALSREWKSGVIALVTIIGMYFAIQFLKGNDLIKGTNTFYAVYPNVEGLTPTSPVSVLGMKAGAIDKITFDQKNQQMHVRMRLKKDFVIPKGSVSEIYSADILGGKAVQIRLSQNAEAHHSGDTLLSSTQKDLMGMLTGELMGLKDQIGLLLENLNTTVLGLQDVLSTENKENLSGILASLDNSMTQLRGFAQSLNQNAPRLNHIMTNVDTLSIQLQTTVTHLNTTMAHFADVSQDLKDAEIAKTINQLQQLLTQLQNPDGSLGQLMQTPSLHQNLNEVLLKVDSLVQLISDNPKKYLRISVF